VGIVKPRKETTMHPQTQQQSNVIDSVLTAAYPDLPPRQPYFTVAQFSKRNAAFSQSALRNLVFKADARESTRGTITGNGLIECGAIVRLGRKVLIHEGRFFSWLEAQQ
jgi:hypothetical protein